MDLPRGPSQVTDRGRRYWHDHASDVADDVRCHVATRAAACNRTRAYGGVREIDIGTPGQIGNAGRGAIQCFKANVLEHESSELKRWEDLLAQCCSIINAYKADIVTTGDGFMREYIDQLQVIAAEPDLANFLMNMNSDQVTLECTKTVTALLGEKGPATRFCQIWFTSKQLHLTHVQVVKSLGLFDDESTSCLCKEFQTIRDSIFFPISVAQTLNRVSPKQSVAEMAMKLENMIAFNGHLAATLAAVVRCACPALPVLVAHHDFGGDALVPK